MLVLAAAVWCGFAAPPAAAATVDETVAAPATGAAAGAEASAAEAQLRGASFDNGESPSFTWSLGNEIGWDDERFDFVAAKGVAR